MVGLGRGSELLSHGQLALLSVRPSTRQPQAPMCHHNVLSMSQTTSSLPIVPPPHKKAGGPGHHASVRICSTGSRSRTEQGSLRQRSLSSAAQQSCPMESQGDYKRCQTLEDLWKLFSFQLKTTEDGTEPMAVTPLEEQEEAMEVESLPTKLIGYRSAEPRLCLKKGARRAGRVWPHPRLYWPSSSAVVRYDAAGGKPRL